MSCGPTHAVTPGKLSTDHGKAALSFDAALNMPIRGRALLFLAALLALGMTCPSRTKAISRDRAIEIARPHVSFQPDNVAAERATSGTRRVWRVTFQGRLPGQPPGLFETTIIEIDRTSGEVVSIGRT